MEQIESLFFYWHRYHLPEKILQKFSRYHRFRLTTLAYSNISKAKSVSDQYEAQAPRLIYR